MLYIDLYRTDPILDTCACSRSNRLLCGSHPATWDVDRTNHDSIYVPVLKELDCRVGVGDPSDENMVALLLEMAPTAAPLSTI